MIFTIATAIASLSHVGRNPFSGAPESVKASPSSIARQLAPPQACGAPSDLAGDVMVAVSGNTTLYRNASGGSQLVTSPAHSAASPSPAVPVDRPGNPVAPQHVARQ